MSERRAHSEAATDGRGNTSRTASTLAASRARRCAARSSIYPRTPRRARRSFIDCCSLMSGPARIRLLLGFAAAVRSTPSHAQFLGVKLLGDAQGRCTIERLTTRLHVIEPVRCSPERAVDPPARSGFTARSREYRGAAPVSERDRAADPLLLQAQGGVSIPLATLRLQHARPRTSRREVTLFDVLEQAPASGGSEHGARRRSEA